MDHNSIWTTADSDTLKNSWLTEEGYWVRFNLISAVSLIKRSETLVKLSPLSPCFSCWTYRDLPCQRISALALGPGLSAIGICSKELLRSWRNFCSALSQNFCLCPSLLSFFCHHASFLTVLRPSLSEDFCEWALALPWCWWCIENLEAHGLLGIFKAVTPLFSSSFWFFSCFLTSLLASFSLFSIFIWRWLIRYLGFLTSSDGFSLTAVFLVVLVKRRTKNGTKTQPSCHGRR